MLWAQELGHVQAGSRPGCSGSLDADAGHTLGGGPHIMMATVPDVLRGALGAPPPVALRGVPYFAFGLCFRTLLPAPSPTPCQSGRPVLVLQEGAGPCRTMWPDADPSTPCRPPETRPELLPPSGQ